MKKLVSLLAVLFCIHASGQALGTGAYNFAPLESLGFDQVNTGNLNVRFNIPLVSRAGRALPFNYALQYEGLIWSAVTTSGVTTWQNDPNWGFEGQLNGSGNAGYLTYIVGSHSCPRPPNTSGPYINHADVLHSFVYHDAFGAAHPFKYIITEPCPDDLDGGSIVTGDGSTSDGSGYTFVTSNGWQVKRRDGTVITPVIGQQSTYNSSITDSNGNQITSSGSVFTDTLGVTALTIGGSGTSTSPRTFTYPVALQADGANTKAAVIYYADYVITTNFQCSGIGEVGQDGSLHASMVDSVQLASGDTYHFTYESTPGFSGRITGRLHSVTLPTNGTITYNYSGGCSSAGAGINADGTVGSLTRITSDGTRTYSRGVLAQGQSSTQLTDEKNNVTQLAFITDSTTGNLYETHRQAYQGSGGTPLLERYTCLNGQTAPCTASTFSPPITERDVLESYDGGSQVLVKNFYDSNGSLLTESDVYQAADSSLLTKMEIGYNTLGEVTSKTQRDGNGTAYTYAQYAYDEGSLVGTSNLPQHLAVSGPRGNLTSSHVSAGATFLDSSTAYNDAGMPTSTTVPDGGVTTYSYDSTGAFVQGTALPVGSLSTSAQYDAYSASLHTSTGMNDGETTTLNQYDPLMRPANIALVGGSVQNINYYGANHTFVTRTLDSQRTAQAETLLDDYGRLSRKGVFNGQPSNGWYDVDYCYDGVGALSYVSTAYAGTGFLDGSGNPTPKHCATTSTSGGTAYSRDALGRVTGVTTPDGTATTQYLNRAVETTDVNGVQKITQYDLLGRISRICEISSATLAGVAPGDCGTDIGGTGFLTLYSYNLATATTQITQGNQVRTFTTDAAGRTTSVTEPERGTTTYTYANGGDTITRTRPKANQTDPNVTTNTVYSYDSLGRLYQITYDDGITPTKYFYYDQSAPWQNWSVAPSNTKGRLAAVQTDYGATTRAQFSYDIAGNVTTMWQCAPSICGTGAQEGRPALQFGYDLAGTLLSYSGAATGSIVYGRSLAEEITSVTNLSYNDTYNPGNLLSGVTNTPFGPTNWNLGNGVSVMKGYDTLGRNNSNYVCSGTSCGSAYYGNISAYSGSRVVQMCDTVVNQCQNHAYDDFNRLSAVNSTNSGSTSFAYTYDRWGNRLSQTGPPSVTFSFDAANHNTNFSYDAAGNQMNDALHSSYTYDAEGKVLSVDGGATATYRYDALDNRVQTQVGSNTTEYVYDPSGRRMSNWLVGSGYGAAGFGNEGRIYWDGGLLANRSFNGTTYFHHTDWLGTERMRTDYQGNVANTQVSYAFGDGFNQTSTDTAGAAHDNNQFTSQERDAETGTTHFQFRQYSPTEGRWMSPDPYSGSYDWGNPQSLNRYAYALNNPYSLVDRFGLSAESCDPGDDFDDSGCGVEDGGISGGGGGGGTPDPCAVDPSCVTVTAGPDPGPPIPPPIDPCLGVICYVYFPGSSSSGSSGNGDSGGVGQSTAPNNGSFQLASFNPMNPCSNANPNNLDYSTTNAQQHILQNHTPGGKGPSFYVGDWTAISLFNQATLTQGSLAPAQFQRSGTFTLQWSAPQLPWPLSLIWTNNIGWGANGQPTPTNRLVVKTNCSTVITSYPVN